MSKNHDIVACLTVIRPDNKALLGVQVDGIFFYTTDNQTLSKCLMKRVKGRCVYFELGIPLLNNTIFPKILFDKYITEKKIELKIKRSTDWLTPKFSTLRIKRKSFFNNDDMYYDEKHVIRAKGKIYYLDSSGEIVEEPFKPKSMFVEIEYSEGESPQGMRYLSDLYHKLHTELSKEKIALIKTQEILTSAFKISFD